MGNERSKQIQSQQPLESQRLVAPDEQVENNYIKVPDFGIDIQPNVVENGIQDTEESPKMCNVDVHKWFLIHSIILSILNIPLLFISTLLFGLSIFPFTYNLILLIAAIWKNIPALQTIKVLAYVNLTACSVLLVVLPSGVTFMNPFHSFRNFYADRDRRFPDVVEVVGTALIVSIPVFILIILFLIQLYLVGKVLEFEQAKMKKTETLLRNAAANRL